MKKALCGLGLAFFCLQASAFDWKTLAWVVTNETLYRYNRVADSPHQFYEAFNLTLKAGPWSGGLTLRAKNFFKQEPNQTLDPAEFDIYRVLVQYQNKSLRLQAGDFHAMLGQGLVLAVLPNEALLRERAVRGGDAELFLGRWRWRALGGVVRDDTGRREWGLWGAESEVRYGGKHKAGLHFSSIDDIGAGSAAGPRLSGSASLAGEFAQGALTYSLEAAFLEPGDPDLEKGHAVFAGCAWRRGPWTAMAEVKSYKHFSNELNNPPNADRPDEMGALDDARAARLYLQYSFAVPDLLLFANASVLQEMGVSGHHFYGGLAVQDLFGRLNFSASAGIRRVVYPVLRLDADALLYFAGPWSAELTWREKSFRGDGFRFLERDLVAQLALARRGSVFLQYQYSAQPVLERHDFFSGGVRVYFGPASYLEATAGSQRGGEVCTQGQCFYVQPFQGFKLAFFATFR